MYKVMRRVHSAAFGVYRVAKKAMEFDLEFGPLVALETANLGMQYYFDMNSLLSELVPRPLFLRCSSGRIDGFAVQLSCGGGLDTLKDANYILPKT